MVILVITSSPPVSACTGSGKTISARTWSPKHKAQHLVALHSPVCCVATPRIASIQQANTYLVSRCFPSVQILVFQPGGSQLTLYHSLKYSLWNRLSLLIEACPTGSEFAHNAEHIKSTKMAVQGHEAQLRPV